MKITRTRKYLFENRNLNLLLNIGEIFIFNKIKI